MEELINIRKYPEDILKILLQDKSTNENIIFATDTYCEYGSCYSSENQITIDVLKGFPIGLHPRIFRDKKEQLERTRSKAEVYTSSWICNKMINYLDADWFQSENIFNVELENSWNTTIKLIEFNSKNWNDYVDSSRLEIACGEAPYLVSRYDTTTGNLIDVNNRIGILDRKLRVVNENTTSEKDWFKWVYRAYQSVYGYELQGDSLLIARINLLQTFIDNLQFKWNRQPTLKELKEVAKIISWNVWQMDGLTDCIPFGNPNIYDGIQLSIFDMFEEPQPQKDTFCYIKHWRKNKKILFKNIKESDIMKFDFIIGNPPYQEETKDTSDKPVYNIFMDSAFNISNKVMLITPARFLFNAGKTPKVWNEKMINDKHLKVMDYEQDSSKFFKNTDVKGGIAITYRDSTKDFGAIVQFTTFQELNSILKKVISKCSNNSLSEYVYAPESYKFTSEIHSENPWVIDRLSKGHQNDLTTNIFEKLPEIFTDNKPNDDKEYIQIYGRMNNERVYKYVRKDYICNHENLMKYKVIVPKSNGSGAIGEVLSTPMLGTPMLGTTQSFISIGAFNTEYEGLSCLKYIKSKFARCMLGILKVTQDNKRNVWKYVPLQDFTENSDIDWNTSIANIDRQLYKKYNLSQEEIDFIEKNVKPME